MKKLFFAFAFLFCGLVCKGQSAVNSDLADSLIKKLHSWDSGYKSCCYFSGITDPAMKELIKMGKPVAQFILPLFDSTHTIIPAHFILSKIYDNDAVTLKTQTVSQSETLVVTTSYLNGLKWITNTYADGTKEYKFDTENFLQVAGKWQSRIAPADTCVIKLPPTVTANKSNFIANVIVSYNCPIEKFYLEIYNRWGQLIYKTSILNTDNSVNWNCEKLPSGPNVYHWKIVYTTWGNEIKQEGNINLIK